MDNKLFNKLVLILSAGILACLGIVTFSELNTKESSLLGILLTILSFLASWLVSKHFADNSHKQAIEEVKEQHQSNLRTYALNAAEKVNNLSSELARLSVYLQQELEEDEDEDENNAENLYLSAYERIESAIHIINTLKSVNDTYLSDWKGVIGEELDERMEEQQERENELRLIVEKVENIVKSRPTENKENYSEVQKIGKQINDLRKELNFALNSVSGTFVRTSRISTKAKKEQITTPCPYCENPLTYYQRPKPGSFKFVECEKCNHKPYAKWEENAGFRLIKEEILNESYKCPWCENLIGTTLSNYPQSKSVCRCNSCHGSSQIIRTVTKFNIHPIASPETVTSSETKVVIDENILEKLKNVLPVQPWEKGIHRIVAGTLNLPLNVTRHHISELIRRGVFKPQIDGILYEPSKQS